MLGVILGVLGVLILIGILTWRVMALNSNEAGRHPKVVTAAGPTHGGHGDSHGHGHGHNMADIAFTVFLACVGVCLIVAAWYIFGAVTSAPRPMTPTSAASQIAAPSAPVVDPGCIMTKQPQFCDMDAGKHSLVMAGGLPSGLYFCITPDINEAGVPADKRVYKSVKRILNTGDAQTYGHDNLAIGTVIGYELELRKPKKIHQFMAESPDAAGC